MCEKFVLRDEMARLPDQHGENIEGFRRQPDDMVTTQQLALAHVECEITETERLLAAPSDFGES